MTSDFENTPDERLTVDAVTEAVQRSSKQTHESLGLHKGQQIGHYKLIEILGEGGFGVVWRAAQSEPVKREVALKIIKPGMDTKSVIARFEAERQALAVMDHPCVAKVFDAGVTSPELGNRPYFVMELVPGVPITQHCDRQKLNIQERLELFMLVCKAVQHAHQKGIIHRDIKPDNILVTVRDGQATPKVIDFGIAKALHQKLTEQTLFTEQGQFIGTPEYMSPEQAEMSAQDIDTRSDIYSLGVILYELLTGARPFEPETLRRAGLAEIQRVIREEDPPKPSTRLLSLGDNSALYAKNRKVDSRVLARSLRGDLDWIVMKAMEKDRTRRYDSATNLVEDINRHLQHEPVLASPPSTSYKLTKFVRRNKVGVIASAVVAIALLVSTVVSIVFAMQANTARESALASLNLAEQRTDELEQVSEFQASQLSGIDVPLMAIQLRSDLIEKAQSTWKREKDSSATVEDRTFELETLHAGVNFTDVALRTLDKNVFEGALIAVNNSFANQPLVQARLLQTLADTLRSLGILERATVPLTESLRIYRRLLGDEHEHTMHAMNSMGMLLENQGKYEESKKHFEESLQNRRKILGNEHADTLVSINNVALILHRQGKYDEALQLTKEVLAARRRAFGNEHQETLSSIDSIGSLLSSQGKYDEAGKYHREALEGRRRTLGNDHIDTLTSVNNLGGLLISQGRYDDALPYYQESLDSRRRIFGDDHPNTLNSINNMGSIYKSLGKYEQAELYYREAVERYRRTLGNNHPSTLNSLNNMGTLLDNQGKPDEAKAYLLEALAGYRRMYGLEHSHTLASLSNLGSLLQSQGKLEEAEPYTREALAGHRTLLGDEHPDTLSMLNNLGLLKDSQRQFDEAEMYYKEAVDGFRHVLGNDHPSTLNSINNLGALFQRQKKYTQAEPYLREALAGNRRVLGNLHTKTVISISNMSSLLREVGKFEESEALCAEAVENGRAVLPEGHWYLGAFLGHHAKSLLKLNRLAESEERALESHQILKSSIGEDHEYTLKSVQTLIDLYTAWHEAEPNKGYDVKAKEWQGKMPKEKTEQAE